MARYIVREEVIERINKLFIKNSDGSVAMNDYNNGINAAKVEIGFIAGVSDTLPVIETQNIATVLDEFICKRCGIHLKAYIKVVPDQDEGCVDEEYYDYEPKFCSECGTKVESCIKALKRNEPLYTMAEICKMNGVEFDPRDVIEGGLKNDT